MSSSPWRNMGLGPKSAAFTKQAKPSVDFTSVVSSVAVDSQTTYKGSAGGPIFGSAGLAAGFAPEDDFFMSIMSFMHSHSHSLIGKLSIAFMALVALLMTYAVSRRLWRMMARGGSVKPFRYPISPAAPMEASTRNMSNAHRRRNVALHKKAEVVEAASSVSITETSASGQGIIVTLVTFSVSCFAKVRCMYDVVLRKCEGTMMYPLAMLPLKMLKALLALLRYMIIVPWQHVILMIRWMFGINKNALSNMQDMLDRMEMLTDVNVMIKNRRQPQNLRMQVASHLTDRLMLARESGLSEEVQRDLSRAIEVFATGDSGGRM